MAEIKLESQKYYTKDVHTETYDKVDEQTLREILAFANTCKTAHLNDVQIVADGMLIYPVLNRSDDLIKYLNGELDEF